FRPDHTERLIPLQDFRVLVRHAERRAPDLLVCMTSNLDRPPQTRLDTIEASTGCDTSDHKDKEDRNVERRVRHRISAYLEDRADEALNAEPGMLPGAVGHRGRRYYSGPVDNPRRLARRSAQSRRPISASPPAACEWRSRYPGSGQRGRVRCGS